MVMSTATADYCWDVMSTDRCRLFYSQRWDGMVMSTARCRLLLGCDVYESMQAIVRM